MKHRFLYIYAAFVVSLSVLLILSVLLFQQVSSMLMYNRSVENTYRSLNELQALNILLVKLETATRGYMLTSDSAYLVPFVDHKTSIQAITDTLNKRVGSDSGIRNRLAMLKLTIKMRLSLLYQLIDITNNTDTTRHREILFRSKSMMDQLQKEMYDLEQEELKKLHENFEKKKFYENLAPSYLKITLLFTCIITIGSFFFLNRLLRQRLRYQKELENKVDELHRANEELEQLAHVASHDLQEPLRKMRTFSSRLLLKYSDAFDDDVKLIFNRIEASAVSMQELINDLVVFTNIIDPSEKSSRVDLDSLLEKVLDELQPAILSINAVVEHETLPTIVGYPKQLYLLFKCLLENSLKFQKKGVCLKINLRVEQMIQKGGMVYRVSIEDNGIGFDNAFNEKIFVLFQRLHGRQSEYGGKGIGLAIARRIVINHKGTISASGNPGKGAVLEIALPA